MTDLRTPDETPMPDVKEPDEMGVWSDDDAWIWLPRSLYPKRNDAVKWAMKQWSCHFLDVRCLSRWMVYDPRIVPPFTLDGHTDPGFTEDLWSECDKATPGAFRVWRLESQ